MDSSEVGKFGTLRLMKRLDPDKVVASYPIDTEELTIGRDASCNIRLYYDSVSPLHCKIIFNERKAFLVVLGTEGLLVDGCPVFPTAAPATASVTIPLPNNSTIEITKKRFLFCYPPKEFRAALLATPTQTPERNGTPEKRRPRTLRMSMIQSAQVFTPRPSQDPRENLRILKTPIKTPFQTPGRRRRESSPLKRGMYIPEDDSDEEEDTQEIVLVESNHPRVVEEDRDLVILEHVKIRPPSPERPPIHTPQHHAQYPIPQNNQPSVQQTPRHRHPRASLHKAVLIRSAQRAMKMEIEREEEADIEEVEDVIQDIEDVEEEEEEDQDYAGVPEDVEESSYGPFSGLRKSLDAVKGWALRPSSVPRDVQPEDDEDEEEQDITEAVEEEDPSAPELEEMVEQPTHRAGLAVPHHAPMRHINFMTPQPKRTDNRFRRHIRYSAGGFAPGGIGSLNTQPRNDMALPGATTGPRRVRVVEPWKVDDIEVPLKDEGEMMENVQEDEERATYGVLVSPAKREHVSEEERRAILERRRSALHTPDNFFRGGTPGSRRQPHFPQASPIKALFSVPETIPGSPSTPSVPMEPKTEGGEAPENTSIMLARMKQMVDVVKKRQSIGPRPSLGAPLSPKKAGRFSLFAPDAGEAPTRPVATEQGEEEDDDEEVSDKENDVQEQLVEDEPEAEKDREEEVDMEVEPEEPLVSHHPPITPHMGGLRHMFTAPREIQTPRMDGVRNLFQPERVMPTPVYEGIGELMPEDPEPEHEEVKIDEDTVMEEPEPEPEPEPVAAPARVARAKKAAIPVPALAARRPAARIVATSRTVHKEESQAPKAETTNIPSAAVAHVVRKPKARGGEAAVVVPEPERLTTSGIPTKTMRRTKKTDDSGAPSEITPAAATGGPSKSLRKPRAGVDASKTAAPEEPPATKARTVRRAKTPTGPPEGAHHDNEDNDPIDSINRAGSPEPATATGASRVRRSARSKVKEEELDEGVAIPNRHTEPRLTRARKPTVPSSGSSIPKVTRAATTGKKPTAAALKLAAAVGGAPPGNKENTPEGDVDEEEKVSGKPVPGRTAAGTKIGRAATRTRAAEEPIEPEPTRATRVSRTKVKR